MLTIKEVAQDLNLSESIVRALCNRRKPRHERHGLGRGVIRIPEDAIEESRRGVTVEVAAETVAVTSRSPPRPRKFTLD